MKKLLVVLLLIFTGQAVEAQNTSEKDAAMLEAIYKESLLNGNSYNWLDHLSNKIGGRLSGSINAQKAVQYTKEELEKLGLDRVWLQPVMVPKWVRGLKEYSFMETGPGVTSVMNICALGGSVATPNAGLKANVVEVSSLEELDALGSKNIKGKIVFFNRPMRADLIQTFEAYGGCVDQRYSGAKQAAKYGAVGIVVRSMNLRNDDFPHTGAMSYGDLPASKRIPACAISTNDANKLSNTLKLIPELNFYFKQNCKTYPDVESHNVIGEITGSTYPNKYMIVGGHLDSWDLGDGSHDDGAPSS